MNRIRMTLIVASTLMMACSMRPMFSYEESGSVASSPPGTPPRTPPHDASTYDGSLPTCVRTKVGCLELETVYIAGVVECELGSLTNSAAALEAQAIAARTFLGRYLARKGPTAMVHLGPRFQCWRKPRFPRSVAVALATAGNVILWDGALINANYVAGTRKLNFDCRPKGPGASGYPFSSWSDLLRARKARKGRVPGVSGTDWTEIYVTHNEGRVGRQVAHTPIGWKTGFNRGALSQNAAACLGKNLKYETMNILKYFYGDDIVLSHPLRAVTSVVGRRIEPLAMSPAP